MKDLSNKILPVIYQICKEEPSLPCPIKLLNIGNSGGHVYDTSDPQIVLRAAQAHKSDCEYVMDRSALQNSGGVVKIFHIEKRKVGSSDYVFSWKEKVNTNVLEFLNSINPKPMKLIRVLSGLYSADEEDVEILSQYKQTINLYQALKEGLPINDLDLKANLGVNKDGNIIAYDC